MKPTLTTSKAKVTPGTGASKSDKAALAQAVGAVVSGGGANRSLAELIDQLSRFDGPPPQFLSHLLAGQCEIGRATRGAILRQADGGALDVLAVYPQFDMTKPPAWLKQAMSHAPRVCEQALTLTMPAQSSDAVYEEEASRYLVMVPLLGDGGVRGAEAFLINSNDVAFVNECSSRIELTVSLINLYEMRLTVERSKSNLGRLGKVVEVTAAVNEHERLEAAGMALCNQIASQWAVDRVSLGFLHNRSVRLSAMSHTNQFSRKMKMVQAIEAAMEECVDQDLEVFVSRVAGGVVRLSRFGGVEFALRPDGRVEFAVATSGRANCGGDGGACVGQAVRFEGNRNASPAVRYFDFATSRVVSARSLVRLKNYRGSARRFGPRCGREAYVDETAGGSHHCRGGVFDIRSR